MSRGTALREALARAVGGERAPLEALMDDDMRRPYGRQIIPRFEVSLTLHVEASGGVRLGGAAELTTGGAR